VANGKKYNDATKRYDQERMHSANEALDLVRSLAPAKFDETVELVARLGVDPRKADQMVRGTVALPSGTGGDVRVAVFAQGEAAAAAKEAGADIVGADDLAEQVEGGMYDFDVAIATPDMMPVVGRLGRALGPRGLMPNPKTGTVTTDVAIATPDLMPQVGKLGRVLGPRGLMPNPKTGTVTPDVGKAVTDFKGGKVEYRTDRYGNVHVPLGKVSFAPDALTTNYRAVVEELERAKPAAAKGKYFRKITFSSTMGPGIKVDTNRRNAYAVEE